MDDPKLLDALRQVIDGLAALKSTVEDTKIELGEKLDQIRDLLANK